MIFLERIKRTDKRILSNMSIHYSQPRGFVGRNICYAIMVDNVCFGTIAGGSATRFLPGREVIGTLNNGINNIFFHIEKQGGAYPLRWFSAAILAEYRKVVEKDWKEKYGDNVFWHETLVELPREGQCYKKDGWSEVGITKGYTCKRIGGQGSDSWTGKRIWDTTNLRPKRVFVHLCDAIAQERQ